MQSELEPLLQLLSINTKSWKWKCMLSSTVNTNASQICCLTVRFTDIESAFHSHNLLIVTQWQHSNVQQGFSHTLEKSAKPDPILITWVVSTVSFIFSSKSLRHTWIRSMLTHNSWFLFSNGNDKCIVCSNLCQTSVMLFFNCIWLGVWSVVNRAISLSTTYNIFGDNFHHIWIMFWHRNTLSLRFGSTFIHRFLTLIMSHTL